MKTERILIQGIELNENRTEGGKGDIKSLARNMDRYGQINAVTVVENTSGAYRYRIIAGRRRVAAAQLLGWAKIRADVYSEEEISGDREEIIALSENAAREEMNAIDEGILYANELKKGTPVEELAELFCRSKSAVYQRAKLASLIPSMRELYKKGRMSLHVAAMASALPDEAQKNISAKYANNTFSVGKWNILNAISEASMDFMDQLGNCEACATCSKRTHYSDKTLFPELAESDDRCLDHECYCKKLSVRLEQSFNEFCECSKGTPELNYWDGKRIVTTKNIPDGTKVFDIVLGDIDDNENNLNDEDEEIKKKLEDSGKVEYVPCWDGTKFSFIELAKLEDIDGLYYKEAEKESEWDKKQKEKIADIFQSIGEEKRNELLSDISSYTLISDVKNMFIKKIENALLLENCDVTKLIIFAAQLSLSNTQMRHFLEDAGITKEDICQSFAVFEKLQKISEKKLYVALINSRLEGYGPKPDPYGISGSDWEKIFSHLGLNLSTLRDEAVKNIVANYEKEKEDADSE